MTTEILKSLIKENYISVSEAVWLIKTFSISEITTEKVYNVEIVAKDLLEFIKAKKSSSQNLTIEDELFFFSTQNHLELYISLEADDDEIYEEDDDDDEYSEEELIRLREIEQKVISQGHSKILNDLMTLIEKKYSIVFNGFNKLEYQRAKSQFWKIIGFEDYGYHSLSSNAKKFLDDIYNASEPLVKKKVAERELEILPDLTNKFGSWISEHNHKQNKTNLKQYLKDNGIKLSNPNIDKILSSVK